jgi:phosphomevalonate kinase
MGQQASVPIEPPTQTALLDDSLKVKGVFFAGVPGAGGYDAIFCLIADDGNSDTESDTGSTFHRLRLAWKGRVERVCPLLAQHDENGLVERFDEKK